MDLPALRDPEGPHRGVKEGGWWARQDSNLEPTPYEGAALPLSYGPLWEGEFGLPRKDYTMSPCSSAPRLHCAFSSLPHCFYSPSASFKRRTLLRR